MTEFKKQLLLKLGIGLGVTLVLVTMIFLLSSDINRRVRQIQSNRSELLFRTQTIDALAALKGDFGKAKPHLSFLESILPPKDQLISFSKDLEVLAKQNRVDLGFSFGTEAPSTETSPGSLSFTVTFAGNFSDLIKFFKDVYMSRYFVNLVSLDLGRRDNTYGGNLSGRVYSQ